MQMNVLLISIIYFNTVPQILFLLNLKFEFNTHTYYYLKINTRAVLISAEISTKYDKHCISLIQKL